MAIHEGTLRSLIASRLAARLRIDPGEVDLRERFNRQGLDSAGATALIAELSAELGRPLSPTLVWAHPSVEELARHLSGVAGGSTARQADRTLGRTSEPIAIVGMACRFPQSPNPQAFWRLLRDGVDATRTVPPDRWDADALYDPDPQAPDTINTRRGAFLDRVDLFDPMFFGISPREACEMDPQQRLALELAWEALEDAGIPPRSLSGTRTGVFMGVIFRDYADLHRTADAPVTSHTGPGTSLAMVANRISYLFGLRGPSLSVDTACSSSLVSVHLACQSLRDGECSLALAGGVNLILYPGIAVELTKFGGLSGDGRCKAFDARADGFARGEGAGVVVLKPLSRALADGDPVYALIRGGAVNNDGFSNGLTAPSPQAQVEVLTDACARAGVDPRRIQYVETHGTGTPLGDPIEARALAAVLCADGAGRDPERPLVIGSAKTNIAHQEGSAGIAGLIKLALAIHHREIPPSLHFERPNPDIPFEELGLRVQTALGPWPVQEEEALLAGVSSFGWGGTNAHLILEGPHPPGPPLPERERGEAARAVFVFSGLGSQWAGMGLELLRSEPLVRARLERCDR
ncbi:MAG TPA: beta-ketoacyl synthase N-terminal-like domain-containing protein, partial [Thermoanaerobaculia bacterium]|nr:beta-ketoacyl synthase N-terminal-like domain-containing protein [Thermoanaerobaculia bacterium]